ncbi:MAG: radical SAM protein [Candidatus Methanofastidiosia archaeon]
MVIRKFDPWKSQLCTCPEKYSLNPYTGCDHRCVYCYITSYIKDAFRCRPKHKLITKIKRELPKIDLNKVISLSNSSDPYPRLEKKLRLTRTVIELFLREKVKFQIITKSDIVVKDIDLLGDCVCSVAVTVTTMDKAIAGVLEPGAPLPEKRVNALRILKDNGIPVSVRIDPVILGLTDPVEVLEHVKFADHVTASTLKLRPDGVKRMVKVFPGVMRKLRELCTEKVGNALYLPEDVRFELLQELQERCYEYGISFGTCREGFGSEKSCDGTHLVK